MSNLKPLKPEDIDETLIKLITFSDRHYVLFPFVDATGAAPEFKSLGHPTDNNALTAEDLVKMSSQMQRRAESAVWYILFSTPWLVRQADADAMRKRPAGPHRGH